MADLKGMAYLKAKLARKQSRVRLRYRFYEMKNAVPDFGISSPPSLRALKSTLGWCSKAVDSLADRLIYRTFEDDLFDMAAIYSANNADILIDDAILSALISSCSFVYISPDGGGYPRLQVIDGGNATGEIDPITNLLTEGYAVLSTDDKGNVISEAWFTPDFTEYHLQGQPPYRVDNPAPYPLLVPIINRPDAKRPFGHSRISRSCMSLMQEAARTLKRAELAGEFSAFPQKYILGTAEDAEIKDTFQAAMSWMLNISKDEDGDKPTVGQFQQLSMAPYVDQLRMFAALFAGETGLTLDDLGFVSDNPSSAEAIKASHENLRLMARKAQRNMAVGLINAGYLAACVRDDYAYNRQQVAATRAVWEPIFEPDAAMLSGIGDGAIKINQAVPGYFGRNNLRTLTGVEADQA